MEITEETQHSLEMLKARLGEAKQRHRVEIGEVADRAEFDRQTASNYFSGNLPKSERPIRRFVQGMTDALNKILAERELTLFVDERPNGASAHAS